MKKIMLFTLLFVACNLHAGHKEGEQWQQTTLPDSAIEHIQEVKYKHSQCIQEQIEKVMAANIDSRKTTDSIIRQCETVLTEVRQVFINEKVPAQLANRYMKQIRTQTTRNTLKYLMFIDATKKMGYPIK